MLQQSMRCCAFAILAAGVAIMGSAAEPQRLTEDGRLKRDPVYWPDGKSIVYTVEQPSGRMKLVRLNLADRSTKFLHDDENLSDRELTVAADGNVYAYNVVTGGKGINTDIKIARLNSPAVLTAPVKGWSHWPSVSHDGRQVVFAENGETIYLFTIDFDDLQFRDDVRRSDEKTSDNQKKDKDKKKADPKSIAIEQGKLRQLARGMWPQFAPNGRTIAFVSQGDNDLEIYSLDVESKEPRRLTDSRGVDARPNWSPDGSRIAFSSNRDGNFEIYVMNADGSDIRRVTNHPERDDFPVWHPSGRQLLFVGERNGSLDLYTIDLTE